MKHRFNRILVAVDDSPCTQKAIDYAKGLAAEFQAVVALLTVIPPHSTTNIGADPIMGQQPILIPEALEIQMEQAAETLHKLAAEFTGTPEVFVFSKVGTVRDVILETASSWTADLIIMGSHGRSGFEHLISGSVSESVIRKASCPVLVIPNKCD